MDDRREALILCVCWCAFACYLYVQVWAVSGEPRDFSGGFQGSSPHRWATPVALHPTPITTRSAQVIHSAPPCVYLHFFTYAYPLHFDVCYLIMPPHCEGVKWVGRTFLREISQGLRDQKKCKGKRNRYRVGKGCFKYSALILSPPSLHLQSTTQNALLQMGYTPPPRPHPPMTYL